MSGTTWMVVGLVIHTLYFCVTTLWTREFYRIQESNNHIFAHVLVGSVLASVGIALANLMGPEFWYGSTYLMMPWVYLILCKTLSALTKRIYSRPLIFAVKNNMMAPETRDAKAWDYVISFFLLLTPLVIPPAIFE